MAAITNAADESADSSAKGGAHNTLYSRSHYWNGTAYVTNAAISGAAGKGGFIVAATLAEDKDKDLDG